MTTPAVLETIDPTDPLMADAVVEAQRDWGFADVTAAPVAVAAAPKTKKAPKEKKAKKAPAAPATDDAVVAVVKVRRRNEAPFADLLAANPSNPFGYDAAKAAKGLPSYAKLQAAAKRKATYVAGRLQEFAEHTYLPYGLTLEDARAIFAAKGITF